MTDIQTNVQTDLLTNRPETSTGINKRVKNKFGSAIDNWDEVLLMSYRAFLAASYWDILGMSKWDFINICAIYKSTLLQRLSHTGRWLVTLSLRR